MKKKCVVVSLKLWHLPILLVWTTAISTCYVVLPLILILFCVQIQPSPIRCRVLSVCHGPPGRAQHWARHRWLPTRATGSISNYSYSSQKLFVVIKIASTDNRSEQNKECLSAKGAVFLCRQVPPPLSAAKPYSRALFFQKIDGYYFSTVQKWIHTF